MMARARPDYACREAKRTLTSRTGYSRLQRASKRPSQPMQVARYRRGSIRSDRTKAFVDEGLRAAAARVQPPARPHRGRSGAHSLAHGSRVRPHASRDIQRVEYWLQYGGQWARAASARVGCSRAYCASGTERGRPARLSALPRAHDNGARP